jgi:hypothetical protein
VFAQQRDGVIHAPLPAWTLSLPIHALEALMNIHVEKSSEPERWWVHMDDWRVGFSTAAEAEQFVERLTGRLEAPHSLDLLVDCSPRGTRGMHTDAGAQGDQRRAKEA